MLLRVLLACLVLVGVSPAGAEPMLEASIRVAMAGATVEVDTPFGMTLPVKYTADGAIAGEAGGLAGFLGSSSDHGKWWVVNDTLCHQWSRWFDREVQCLHLSREGRRLTWSRDDGQKGTATIVVEASAPPVVVAVADARSAVVPSAAPTAAASAAETAPAAASVPTSPAGSPTSAAAASRPSVRPATSVPRPRVVSVKPKAVVQVATAAPVTPTAPPPPNVALPLGGQVPPSALGAGSAHPVAQIAPMVRVSGVQRDDVLYIRRSPSQTAAVVGTIAPESRIRLAGACLAEWCPVLHRGVTGWIGRYYLVDDRTPPVASARR